MAKNITLLKNAYIHPITKIPFHGNISVENGKILDIGPVLFADSKTKIIDCTHHFLFPGFIDVHTHLGLYDEGTGWAGNDANETTEPITPHIRAIDGVYPFDPAFSDAIKSWNYDSPCYAWKCQCYWRNHFGYQNIPEKISKK